MPQLGRRISTVRVIGFIAPIIPFVTVLLGCAPPGQPAPSLSEHLRQEPSSQTVSVNDATIRDASPDSPIVRYLPTWQPSPGVGGSATLPKQWRGLFALPGGWVLGVSGRGRVLVVSPGARDVRELFALPDGVSVAAIDPTGRALAVALPDRVAIFSLATGKEVLSTAGIPTRIADLAFDVEGRVLLCAGADTYVYLWNVERQLLGDPLWQKHLERYAPGDIPGAVVVHPRGRVFFVGTWNGGLAAFLRYGADAFGGAYDQLEDPAASFRAPTTVVKANGPSDAVTQLRIVANGDRLVVVRQSGAVELWKVRGFQKLVEGHAHHGAVYDAVVSPDGKALFTVGRDGFVRHWAIDVCASGAEDCTWEPEHSWQQPGARFIALAGGERLAVGQQHGGLAWVDLPRGTVGAQ